MSMIPLVHMEYHGEVEIAYWEYTLAIVYSFVLYLWAARRKNLMIKKAPEYRYFIWGLWAKIFGGVIFSLIYFYYYKGGDTMSYFFSAASMSKLATKDFMGFLHVLFGEATVEKRSYFDMETGWPYGYVFYDPRTFFVIRVISPLVIVTFNSYLVTTVVLATLSYTGIWNCFRTFVSYYPTLTHKFAIAFLFIPSVIFWGSAILKDTMTLSATCWWVHCLDEIYFKKRNYVANTIGILLSATFIIIIKPYIFMVLFPLTLLWMLHSRIATIRNILIKFIFLPLGLILLVALSHYVMQWLGNRLDKFAIENALRTIEISQADMKRSEQYGSGYFDIGELDGTWSGVLGKFPVATIAGLFRPFLWEARGFTMIISSLENLWLLALVVLALLRTRVTFFLRCVVGNPLLVLSIGFAIFIAFAIGVTTPNFGAMVRFKIPLIPFLLAGVYIILFLDRKRRESSNMRRAFDLAAYSKGDPEHVPQTTKDEGAMARTERR